jgi:4-alpha-glucanotransferase
LTEMLVGEGYLVQKTSEIPSTDAVVAGVHQLVAGAPSGLLLVQAEDLAAMRVGVNLPGTDTERPNWRLRLKEPVETLLAGTTAQTILGAVRASGRGTVEANGPTEDGDGDLNV